MNFYIISIILAILIPCSKKVIDYVCTKCVNAFQGGLDRALKVFSLKTNHSVVVASSWHNDSLL